MEEKIPNYIQHVMDLENENQSLKEENKILASLVLEWERFAIKMGATIKEDFHEGTVFKGTDPTPHVLIRQAVIFKPFVCSAAFTATFDAIRRKHGVWLNQARSDIVNALMKEYEEEK